MGKRIVFERDGVAAVIIPAPHITDLDALAAKRVPEGSPYRIVDAADIPEDRTFRNAWGVDLKVEMGRARDIHRDRIRARRAPMLAALDAEYQRADESGNSKRKAEIAARKQALRDAPADPRIEAAQTPDELKRVDPLT